MATESDGNTVVNRRIFVGGLYPEVSEDDIRGRFHSFGNVSSVDIIRRSSNEAEAEFSKTFAYVNINGLEKNIQKCISVYSKTKWKGHELKLQVAKESYLTRLKRERETQAENPKKVNGLAKSYQDITDKMAKIKAAVPGTEIADERNWVVGKYGRALPVVYLRGTGTAKVKKIDPSKHCHQLRKLKDDFEGENQGSMKNLTWLIEEKQTKNEMICKEKLKKKKRHINGSDGEANVPKKIKKDSSKKEKKNEKIVEQETKCDKGICLMDPQEVGSKEILERSSTRKIDTNSKLDSIALQNGNESSTSEDAEPMILQDNTDISPLCFSSINKPSRSNSESDDSADSSEESSEDENQTIDQNIDKLYLDVTSFNAYKCSEKGKESWDSFMKGETEGLGEKSTDGKLGESIISQITRLKKRGDSALLGIGSPNVSSCLKGDQGLNSIDVEDTSECATTQIREFEKMLHTSKSSDSKLESKELRGGNDDNTDDSGLDEPEENSSNAESSRSDSEGENSSCSSEKENSSCSSDEENSSCSSDEKNISCSSDGESSSFSSDGESSSCGSPESSAETITVINDNKTSAKFQENSNIARAKEHPTLSKKPLFSSEITVRNSIVRKKSSEEKRLKSLSEREEKEKQRRDLVKNALQAVDNKNIDESLKHVKFDSSDEDSMPQKAPVDVNKKDKIGEKVTGSAAVSWLGLESSDDSGAEKEDEHSFSLKPQFEGEHGKELFKLQRKMGLDKRFRIDERFLESEDEASDGAEGSDVKRKSEADDDDDKNNEKFNIQAEKLNALSILETILGKKQNSMAKEARPAEIVPSQLVRYDPLREDHAQYEVQDDQQEIETNEDPKKRGNEDEAIDVLDVNDEKEAPVVSEEKYFDVTESIKDLFQNQDSSTFAFLKNDESSNNAEGNLSKNIAEVKPVKESKFHKILEDDQLELSEFEDTEQNEKEELKFERFFFTADDLRLQSDTIDGPAAFMRPDTFEETSENWEERRVQLRNDFKKKHKDALRRRKKLTERRTFIK